MAVDNLGEVVETLIGPTLPYGDHGVDEKRYENLLAMTDLVEHLLHEIRDAARYVDRPEASMKKIANHAKEFLGQIGDEHGDSAELRSAIQGALRIKALWMPPVDADGDDEHYHEYRALASMKGKFESVLDGSTA